MMYFTRYFHYLRNPCPQNDHYPQFHYTRIKSPQTPFWSTACMTLVNVLDDYGCAEYSSYSSCFQSSSFIFELEYILEN